MWQVPWWITSISFFMNKHGLCCVHWSQEPNSLQHEEYLRRLGKKITAGRRKSMKAQKIFRQPIPKGSWESVFSSFYKGTSIHLLNFMSLPLWKTMYVPAKSTFLPFSRQRYRNILWSMLSFMWEVEHRLWKTAEFLLLSEFAWSIEAYTIFSKLNPTRH